MQKIHIFYRHVHIKNEGRSRDPDKRRPAWFSHERCFQNFMRTLDQAQNQDGLALTIVYDGTEEDFHTDFIYPYCTVPRQMPVTVKIVNAGEEVRSWLMALTVVRDTPMQDDDLVYFVENDYLHLDGWVDKVRELAVSGIACDYISLYDHQDKYDGAMYADLSAKLFATPSQHWRTAPSTCGTFMVKRKTLMEDLDVWAGKIGEYYKFTHLCNAKGRVVVSPVPGLATHCMTGYLSPTIDWSAV